MVKFTTAGACKTLSKEMYAYTSLGRLRQISKEYSKKYRVPIKISSKAFREEDYTDAYMKPLGRGKFVIYLHPIMEYYKEEDIRSAIEHELEHLLLERKQYRKNRKGTEYQLGKPRSS